MGSGHAAVLTCWGTAAGAPPAAAAPPSPELCERSMKRGIRARRCVNLRPRGADPCSWRILDLVRSLQTLAFVHSTAGE